MSPRRRLEGDPAPVYGKSRKNGINLCLKSDFSSLRLGFGWSVQSYAVYSLDLLRLRQSVTDFAAVGSKGLGRILQSPTFW
jgi:hypothetical protein